MRAEGIDNAAGKQKIVVELYDKFFRHAFPKMTERLGIVYTPVEVVDFIIYSVNDLLQKEFDQSLGSKGVHIIDPFTGTGTFITRLLQSGLISKEQLPHKYKNEIHANEIVLLAYYIAAINIEAVYHSLVGNEYQPFEGICLTDTFQLYEKDDMISKLLVDNSARRNRQKKLDIRVIIGNPPYSSGQTSANDNNENIKYSFLDKSIKKTYVKYSTGNPRSLYDSYIRSIRWASDRVGNSGIIGFVSNAGFLDSKAADGMRKCLTEEFSSIYVFHLRGNARTSGEQRRKEKDNVFGQGTRTPIAISLLVKNPEAKQHGQIHWHDIGDYLTQDQKLDIITNFKSVNGISAANAWELITPDKYNDWINQRDDSFTEFIQIGDKKDKNTITLFDNYSSGVKTCRDAWCYNFSTMHLSQNMSRMINFYNEQIADYAEAKKASNGIDELNFEDFIDNDPTKISWSYVLKKRLAKLETGEFDNTLISSACYRPYTKELLYYNRHFNENQYLMNKLFPKGNSKNIVIAVSGAGGNKGFSTLATNLIPNLHTLDTGQCFPLYLYEEANSDQVDTDDLFAGNNDEDIIDGYRRKDSISDEGLNHFKTAYPEEQISKEDIFYYIYGLLHSPEYRARYADNLSKELPRIPCVKKAEDFWSFSNSGRELAELHINYETVECYKTTLDTGKRNSTTLTENEYRVTKMKFAKKKEDGKSVNDKTTVIYNPYITIRDIPLEAYEYVVNGKPALEWVMERQAVSTDKKSGIVNDANLWATETMNNAKYPLELFQRIITVSLETTKIVSNLPTLDIE